MSKRTLLMCSLTLLLAACSGGDNGTAIPPGGASGTPNAGGPPAPAATASISGKINFEGTPPANAKIQMTADPYCAKTAQNPTTEDYKVSDGGLENVIVYVSSPVTGSFPTPTEPVEIDQTACHYVPHVF